MRKIPKAPTEHVDVAIDRMLNEGKELKPKMLLLYENDALMKWEKYQAFVRAGFFDYQAFELCKL